MGWFFSNKKSLTELEQERKDSIIENNKRNISNVINKWEHYLWVTKDERKVKDRVTLPTYWIELKGIEKIRWCYEFMKDDYLKDFKDWIK